MMRLKMIKYAQNNKMKSKIYTTDVIFIHGT